VHADGASPAKRFFRIAPYAIFAINLVTNALAYPTLPDFIPARFDLSGNVTAVGPKWIIWLPTIGMFLALLVMWLADRYPVQFYRPRSKDPEYRERIVPVLRDVSATTRTALVILGILIDALVYVALPDNRAPAAGIVIVLLSAFALLLTIVGGFVRLRRVL
jgi:uncharacterized membrane protein